MEKPLVSIALCTYNGEKFLREQLDSLVLQDYLNIEIIIVDDKSTDNTVEIIKEYEKKHNYISVHINEVNLGFTKNFEKAVGLCKGEYIALCDHDDIWHHQKISKQVSSIADNIFIYHDSEFIQENGISMKKNMSDIVNLYRGNRPEVFLFFNCVSGHSILLRKELLKYALPLPQGFFHDWWLAYVATNIGKIDYISETLIKYRQHEKSDTNILRLKRQRIDKYSIMSSVEKSSKENQWFEYCLNFKENKNQNCINEFYSLYKKRAIFSKKVKLIAFLIKYFNLLFYIPKKTVFSKLNFARKKAR